MINRIFNLEFFGFNYVLRSIQTIGQLWFQKWHLILKSPSLSLVYHFCHDMTRRDNHTSHLSNYFPLSSFSPPSPRPGRGHQAAAWHNTEKTSFRAQAGPAATSADRRMSADTDHITRSCTKSCQAPDNGQWLGSLNTMKLPSPSRAVFIIVSPHCVMCGQCGNYHLIFYHGPSIIHQQTHNVRVLWWSLDIFLHAIISIMHSDRGYTWKPAGGAGAGGHQAASALSVL